MRVRWCETHDCQHYLKDACMRRAIAFYDEKPGGAVNIKEQLEGPKDCVEGWRNVVRMEDSF